MSGAYRGASGFGQLQANSPVVRPMLSPGKPTRRTITTTESNDLEVVKTTCLDLVASGIPGKRASDTRQPLAAHQGEGKQ